MRDFEQTLADLALSFTVQNIMVPKESLVCGYDKESARTLLEEHPDLDVIPIESDGRLSAYLIRGGKKPKDIRIQDMIGAGASILELVEVLNSSLSQERGFCFVLVENRLAGYVHYSDLNNDVVKLPLFIVLENVEHFLVGKLRSLVKEENLAEVLKDEAIERAKKKMSYMKDHSAELEWTTVLYFGELLQFAKHFRKLPPVTHKDIEVLSSVRNKVCHATGPLVDKPTDIKDLSTAMRVSTAILQFG